jgi:hypothetical protein
MIWTLTVALVHQAVRGLASRTWKRQVFGVQRALLVDKMFTRALDYAILFGLATVFDAVVFMLKLLRPSGRSKG